METDDRPESDPLYKKLYKSKSPGWRLLRIIILLPLLAVILFMFAETKLIFIPDKYPLGDWDHQPERAAGINYVYFEEIDFQSTDGTALNGLFCQPVKIENDSKKELAADYIILLCHGNAGNLSHRKHRSAFLAQVPVPVFLFDYRGYGKSAGKPHEKGLYKDTEAAWQLLKDRGYKDDQIIIYGVSLGAGPAIELARHHKAAALVIENAFTSIRDMAAELYPIVPGFIIRTSFNNLEKIPQINYPIWIIHGSDDEIIPVKMAQRLYDAANQPKDLYIVEGADHNSLYPIAGEDYIKNWQSFIKKLKSRN